MGKYSDTLLILDQAVRLDSKLRFHLSKQIDHFYILLYKNKSILVEQDCKDDAHCLKTRILGVLTYDLTIDGELKKNVKYFGTFMRNFVSLFQSGFNIINDKRNIFMLGKCTLLNSFLGLGFKSFNECEKDLCLTVRWRWCAPRGFPEGKC